MTKQLLLPELPENMEWVVHAEADRFTVNLSYRPPANGDNSKPMLCGYIRSHTHRHSAVIDRAEWETEVVNAARHLWTHYTEGNRHAAWADELMRRSR